MKRLLILAVVFLVGACSSDSMSPADSHDPSLPAVYSGTFPCINCAGIQTTLWLRPDMRFFFRQQYLDDSGRKGEASYNLGRWSWDARGNVLELKGAGPARRLTHPDRGILIMRTESDLEHRLSRKQATLDFTPTIRVSGMMKVTGDSATFTECLTGFVAPVRKGGEFARFRHQYRSAVGGSEPAYVELEGSFSWSGDGSLKSLTIERFVTVKDNRAC
jgi:copper homeostasis protein (lipoprotein)